MPGETFQTLKSKATKQAKKSGMSQSAAENYGSAMATQSAVQGGVNTTGEFLGSNKGQVNETLKEIASNVGINTIGPTNYAAGLPGGIIGGSQAATQNVQDLAEERKKAAQEMVEYPPKTKLFEGLGSLNLDDIIDKVPSLLLKGIAGGAKGMQVLLDKIFKPSVEDFNDPVVLAAMNRLFEEKKKELGEEGGNQFKKDYLKNYKDKLNEALTPQLPGFEQEQGFGILDEAGIASLFDDKLADAAAAAQSGALGKGVQRINFPKEFYMDDGKGIMPQTTGGLEDLARLDTKGLEGTNPDLVKMIFNARAILDQNKGNQGGGGAGIPSIATAPTPFTDVNNNGILDNLEVAQATTTPVTATTPVTGIPSLTPTTINYASMAPQFGSQYPGYVNQGLMNQNLSPYYDNLRNYYGIG